MNNSNKHSISQIEPPLTAEKRTPLVEKSLGSEGGFPLVMLRSFEPPQKVLDFIDNETGEILTLNPSLKDKLCTYRTLRYDLLDASRDILFSFYGSNPPINDKGYEVHHRTTTCCRYRFAKAVKVLKSQNHSKAFYGGLNRCADAKTCPVCSGVINERKANEMRLAANQVEALGLHMSMITFTAPHVKSDTLDFILDGLNKANSSFWRGNPAKRFMEKFGIIGRVRSLEIRYGANGWHPHFHLVIFSKIPLPSTKYFNNDSSFKKKPLPIEQQSIDWRFVLSRWQNMTMKQGLSKPNHFGMDIKNGNETGNYITKFGSDGDIKKTSSGKQISWDLPDEMVKGNSKISKNSKSITPWDFLHNYTDKELSSSEKLNNKNLFLEYAKATKGMALIRWSNGLRSIFGLSKKELSDDEIINDEIDSAKTLCLIEPTEWRSILKSGDRTVLLELAENGNIQAIANYLNISVDDLKARNGSFVTNLIATQNT